MVFRVAWTNIYTSCLSTQVVYQASCLSTQVVYLHKLFIRQVVISFDLKCAKAPSWSWSYCSWIYNYPWNHCLSPLKLWVRIPPWRCVLDTTLCDKVCQWLATGRWFSRGATVSSTNKTDGQDKTEILLKVVLKP